MRTIKFRAWDIKNKWMSNSKGYDFISFDGEHFTDSDKKYDTPNLEIERAKDSILMQFTGLTDKNGKEIFEGDILLQGSTKFALYKKTPYEVIFKDCKFKLIHAKYGVYTRNFPLAGDEYEVIGNIYEKP